MAAVGGGLPGEGRRVRHCETIPTEVAGPILGELLDKYIQSPPALSGELIGSLERTVERKFTRGWEPREIHEQASKWTAVRESHAPLTPDAEDRFSKAGIRNICELVSDSFGQTADTRIRQLRRIISQDYLTTPLSVVDEFLVTFGAQHLWYVPPLSDYYFSEEIVGAAA